MATGSSRDIELVVRARDEAGKALTSIADALNTLRGAQDSVGVSAQKTDGLIGALGAALVDLQRQAQGLGALGTVAKQIDVAGAAVARLDKATQTAGENVAALAAKHTQLAEAGARLNTTLTATKAHLDAERAALAQNEAQQARLAAQVHRVGAAYATSRASLLATKTPSEENQAATRGQRDALIALNEQHSAGEERLTAQKTAVKDLATQYGVLNRQVAVNGTAQVRTANDVTNASEAYARAQLTLEKARTELATMTGAGAEASTALGGVAVSQDAVATASKATALSIEEVTAALKRQATAPEAAQGGPAAGNTAAYRAQIQAVQEARQAWQQASAEATRLGQAMATTAGPSRELNTQFVLARTRAAEARQAFYDQSQALNTLRGVTQGSVGAFARAADAMVAEGAAAQRVALGLREIPDIAPQVQPTTVSIRELLAALFRVPAAAGGADGAMRHLGDGARSSMSVFQRLRAEIYGLVTGYIGLYAAVAAVSGVIKTVATLQSAQARLAVVFGGDNKAAAAEMDFIRGVAERLGFSITELAGEYTKVAIAGKEMGFSLQGTREIFVGIAEAVRANGMDASEANGIFQGLVHSIDRGTLSARNFNNQVGMRVPGAMAAMADALGITVQQFEKLQAAAGGVAATEDTLVKFIHNLQELMKPALAKAMDQITAQLGRLQAFLQEGESSAGSSGGFAAAVKSLADDLTKLLNSAEGTKLFVGIGHGLALLTDGIKAVIDNFGLLAKAAQFLIALKVASWVLGIVRANGGLAASFKLAQADATAFNGTLAALNMEKMAGWWASFRVQVVAAGAALAAMGADGAIAAAGTAVADVALGVMNGVMVTVAATARMLWLAVGSFPGLLIMGATFILSDLLGQWMTGVDDANSAMETHDALMQRVIEDYHKATDGADKLAEADLKASSNQIQANKQAQAQALADLRQSAGRDIGLTGDESSNRTLMAAGGTFGGNAQSQAQLAHIIALFKDGKLSAADFKTALNDLATADPSLSSVIAKLQVIADKGVAASTAIADDDAKLKLIDSTANATATALGRLVNAANDLNQAFDPTKISEYTDALEKMQTIDPVTKPGAELQKKIQQEQNLLKTALQSIKIPDATISSIIAGGNPAGAVALPPDQAKLFKDAVDQFHEHVSNLIAEDAHRQAAETAQEVGKGDLKGFIERYFQAEGGNARNPKSNADGYGQFMPATWLALFKQAFPDSTLSDPQKLELRHDKATATKLAELFFEEIIKMLTDHDLAPTAQNMYMGAFLGPEAPRMINAARSNAPGPATQFVRPRDVAENANVFFQHGNRSQPRTAAELYQLMGSHIGQGGLPAGVPERDYTSTGQTAQEEANAKLVEFVKALDAATVAVAKNPLDAFIQQKLTAAQRIFDDKSTPANPVVMSPTQRATVVASATSSYGSTELERQKKLVAELNIELGKMWKNEQNLTREEYIQQQADANPEHKIDLLTAEGQAFADVTGKIYDAAQAKKAYDDVMGVAAQRKELLASLKEAFKSGDTDKVKELQVELAANADELKVLVPLAIEYATAIGDQKYLANLQKVETALNNTKVTLTEAKDINTLLATGLTGVFTKATDALGKFIQGGLSLKNLFKDIGTAFLNFAADFLQKIATMILQQELLNLLSQSPIGGKIAGLVNQATGSPSSGAAAVGTALGNAMNTAGMTLTNAGVSLNGAAVALNSAAVALGGSSAMGSGGGIGGIIGAVLGAGGSSAAGASLGSSMGAMLSAVPFHSGGIAGRPGAISREVWSGVFATARRMHGGGLAGLLPGEVPAILKKNEEVLTENNPRHIFNQGQGGAAPAAPVVNLKNVNAFSYDVVMSEALNTTPGQKAIINFVRQNSRAVRAAMGG